MTKRFDCREYFEVDTKEIAEVMGLTKKQVENTLYKATKKFEEKLKEKLGESVTLYDILPALSGKGDYDEQMSVM